MSDNGGGYGRLIKRRKKSNDEEVEGSTGKKYILSKAQVKKYFTFLENALEQQPCDHTLRYMQKWLAEHYKGGNIDDIIEEIKEMDGYCDCEALMNCYEQYDIG